MNATREVLADRGARYGKFTGHAEITQALKGLMRGEMRVGVIDEVATRVRSRNEMMLPDQIECLEMIAHKIGRILNGDPHYHDSWLDIAGYATLVATRLLQDHGPNGSKGACDDQREGGEVEK